MAKRRVDDYEDSDEYLELKRAIGKRIRTLRIARGLSAKSLSDLAEISSTNFGVIESGYGNVTLLSLDRIAKALVVPLASLFEDTPAVTTAGVEGVLVRLMADLDRVTKQMDVRRDEIAQVSAKIGKGATAARPEAVSEVRWELGRDAQKDDRFSTLAFAGLSAATVAKRMLMEFGVYLTEGAVNSRMTRLQIARDRFDIIDAFDEEAVQRRAAEAKRRVGATLRQCAELHRSFWWRRALGGARTTCREFETSKRYAPRRAERSCGDITAMAA